VQYRIGTCDVCGSKEDYIVKRLPSGNYCSKCNIKRLQYKNKQKDAAAKKPPSNRKKPTGELVFFKALWAFRKHVSFVSGKEIKKFDVNCMSHVLSKGAYPSYRLYDKNLIFLTKEEHHAWHQLGREQLLAQDPNWQKVFDLYEGLKAKYHRDPDIKH